MKKMFRQLAVILALLSIAFCLVGCDALDEMREAHAVYTSMEPPYDISYKDATYKALHFPQVIDNGYIYADWRVFVTAPDVPVLLSTLVGQRFGIDPEEKFLTNYGEIVYVREDVYDAAAAELKLEDPFTEFQLRWIDEDHRSQRYTLTEAEEDIIRGILAEKPLRDDDSYYIENSKTLIFRSETGLFYQEGHTIVKKAEGYFILTYDYNEKGGSYFFPAKGEAADLLAELIAK